MTVDLQIQSRPRNWLPPPSLLEAAPVVDEDDLFPKGTVVDFYPKQGIGRIKTDRNGVLEFSLGQVELIGEKARALNIAAGARIGFDVSWTSKGLKISKIKVY